MGQVLSSLILITIFIIKINSINASGYEDNIFGGGWKLVRRVEPGNKWHPAKDNLKGTESYGTRSNPNTDYTNKDRGIQDTFSIEYDHYDFDEFLFTSGDGKYWVAINKNELLDNKSAFSGRLYTVLASSDNPNLHKLVFYNRDYAPDPLIPLFGHAVSSYDGSTYLYMENSWVHKSTESIRNHNGANVFIRKRGDRVPEPRKHIDLCANTDYPYENNIDNGGWTLVRRVQSGSKWHPSTDNLRGTESYGNLVTSFNENNNDLTINPLYNNNNRLLKDTFSVKYNNYAFDEFLFTSGDGTYWVIVKKDDLFNTAGGNKPFKVKESSDLNYQHTRLWYNRGNIAWDPMVSLFNYVQSRDGGTMLYVEASYSGAQLVESLKNHCGANVFVRNTLKPLPTPEPVPTPQPTPNPTPQPTPAPVSLPQPVPEPTPIPQPTPEPTRVVPPPPPNNCECTDDIVVCSHNNKFDGNSHGCNFHENLNCKEFDSKNGGCLKCKKDYFMKNKHYKCENCFDKIEGCLECKDYLGCIKCDECDGYKYYFDKNCGIGRCTLSDDNDEDNQTADFDLNAMWVD